MGGAWQALADSLEVLSMITINRSDTNATQRLAHVLPAKHCTSSSAQEFCDAVTSVSNRHLAN